ncbi:cholesterol transporter ABCA5 [Drosophila elegans]|uniref:cholesterol transporter ABCA5 n=1 Tax=Drosophila elegans TaxID=30023 RepID=UPI001BC86A49|nr:cholesterol transporter ABCA5 [Drosophila elegans]
MACSTLYIFWLLVWKNFQKQKDNKLVLFLSLLLPVISFSFLLSVRLSREQHLRYYSVKEEGTILKLNWLPLIKKINERRQLVAAKEKNFKRNVFIPQIKVAYAPNSNAAIAVLMEAVVAQLSISAENIVPFKTCHEMRTHASAEHYMASVCFHNVDADASKNGLPKVMHFAIIMPSELRNYESTWIGDTWKEINFLVNPESSDDEEDDEESYSDYLKEGFVALQYYISNKYLESAYSPLRVPKVHMRRFNENTNVLVFDRLDTSAILLILLGFMFPVAVLVKLIVKEREIGQRFAMQNSNASGMLQVAAWFFNGFLEFLIFSVLITCLLKIAWDGIAGILHKSPWHILLFFFISYGVSATSFIIFISSAIRNTKVAIVVVPIIWILVPLPFLSDEELISELPHVFYVIATVLLCSVSFSRGLKKFFYIEDYPGKTKSRKFINYKVMDSDLGLVVPFGCFYFQTLLYTLIALILESNASAYLGGVFKKMCRKVRRTKLYKKIQEGNGQRSWLKKPERKSVDSKNENNASIEFRNVSKKYSKKFAVRDFTFDVYPREVVALLGDNASGKSTIMKMLCGLTQPSVGEVFISGFNVGTHRRQAFKNAASAMSCNTLFSELEVFDHLVFFSRLRGLKKTEAKEEVESYLRSLKMENLEKTQVRRLTTGQKLILQTLCAFVGRRHIVIIDKTFDGMDEATVALFLDFVQEEKKSRTVFFTTNSPKVASYLADRIAILSKGKLLSYGTEKSLCNTFDNAYRLTIYGNESCNFAEVQLFLEKYVANIELDCRFGYSAIFLIKYKDQTELIKLLENLTNSKENLNIYRFQLQACSLDHILLSLFGHEQSSIELENPASQIFRIEGRLEKRYTSLIRDLWVVLRQRLIADFRNWFLPFLKFILPASVAVWTLCMPYFWDTSQPPDRRSFPIGDRDRVINIFQQNSPASPALVRASEEYAKTGAIELNPGHDITMYIRRHVHRHKLLSDLDFLAAAIFSEGEVQALFNNKWPHSAPNSLAMVMNSLAVGFLGSDSGIKVEIDPLPFSTVHTLQLHLNTDGIDLIFACSLCFSFCFIWSIPLLYMALNRESRYNYIELISGMRISLLILAFLIYDIVVVSVTIFPLNIAVLFLEWDVLMNPDIFVLYSYILVIVSICVLSTNILISIGLRKIYTGYLFVLAFNTLGIVIYLAVWESNLTAESNDLLFFLLDFHPFYALLHNLMRVASLSEKIWLCSDMQIYETSVYSAQCQSVPNCCDTRAQQFHHFRYLSCVYVLTIVVWIIIFIFLQSHLVNHTPRQRKYLNDNDPDSQHFHNILHIPQPSDLENTRILEKSRVRTLERNYIERKVLHVEHLSVFFDLKAALKHIDFMCNRYQVLSIFGTNGSGKTVLMKTILGVISPSSGRIVCSNRVPLKAKNLEAYNLTGYSAQETNTFQTLTILESITLLLRVRRSVAKTLASDATTLCKIFGLHKYRFQLLSVCSRGIGKRLSLALALLSDADLILLDDPFTHLDVLSRRNTIRRIYDVSQRGKSVIYTCSDTDFSPPALRMAALNHPRMAAIGERQEIELNYHSEYFVIETSIDFVATDNVLMTTLADGSQTEDMSAFGKLQRSSGYQDYSRIHSDSADRWKYLQLCALIEKIFPQAIIKTVRLPKAWFWLSRQKYSMAQIVKILQLNEQHFYSFTISQPSTNYIFLNISPEEVPKESFSS